MKNRSLRSGSRCTRAVMIRSILAIMISAGLALMSFPVLAEPSDGPFAALQGSWSGTGTIVMSSGAKERIRCSATHHLGASSSELQLALNCESDSYKFNLESQITSSGSAISGNWFEKTRATGGSINGRIAGNQINVRAEGASFNALLSVTTRGDRQSISIQSPGSEMSDVSITLARKSR
jgi:hypothetical protein